MIAAYPTNRIVDTAVTAYWIATGLSAAWILISRLNQIRRQRHLISNGVAAACGSCGYAIIAGSSVICPECGNDVRQSGLITARSRLSWKCSPRIALAAMLAIPIAMQVGPAAAQRQPFGWQYIFNAWWYLPGPDAPHMEAIAALRVTGSGRYFGRTTRILVYNIQVSSPAHSQSLYISDSKSSFIPTEMSHAEDVTLSPETIRRFFQNMTSQPLSPAERVDADEMYAQIKSILNRDFPRRQVWQTYTGKAPRARLSIRYFTSEMTNAACVGIIWFVLTCAAGALIYIRHHRYQAVARARAQIEVERLNLQSATQS